MYSLIGYFAPDRRSIAWRDYRIQQTEVASSRIELSRNKVDWKPFESEMAK